MNPHMQHLQKSSCNHLRLAPICGARELIPGGKDKDFLIVYVPKGTGQPRMYADAFYGEYLASWIRDEQDCWKSQTTHIMKHKQRIKNETSPAILEFL